MRGTVARCDCVAVFSHRKQLTRGQSDLAKAASNVQHTDEPRDKQTDRLTDGRTERLTADTANNSRAFDAA